MSKPKPRPKAPPKSKPEPGPQGEQGPQGPQGEPGPQGATGPEGPGHGHAALRGETKGAIRALLAVFEASRINSDQKKAIHAVRVVIGDAYGTDCEHEETVYEAGDILVCQRCGAVVTPKTEAGG